MCRYIQSFENWLELKDNNFFYFGVEIKIIVQEVSNSPRIRIQITNNNTLIRMVFILKRKNTMNVE